MAFQYTDLEQRILNQSNDNDLDHCPVHNGSVGSFSIARAVFFGFPASIIIITTVVGNLLVLTFRARVGKRQTTMLIWNLGLADFMVGVFVLPLGVAYVINQRWQFGWLLCKIWTACDVVFCTASIVTLCVISVDRYIGVTRPLRYKLIVSKERVLVSIVAIWLFAVSILLCTANYSSPPRCHDSSVCVVSNELRYVVHSVITAFFFPAIITLMFYYKIYTVAVQREKGMRQGLMTVMNESFLSPLRNSALDTQIRVHHGCTREQEKTIAMHKKVAKTLGVVVGAFLICWCPFFILYLVHYHCDCVPLLALDVFSWLGYCNSMLNPIIYAFTVDEFKQSLQRSFQLFWTRLVTNFRLQMVNVRRQGSTISSKKRTITCKAQLKFGKQGAVEATAHPNSSIDHENGDDQANALLVAAQLATMSSRPRLSSVEFNSIMQKFSVSEYSTPEHTVPECTHVGICAVDSPTTAKQRLEEVRDILAGKAWNGEVKEQSMAEPEDGVKRDFVETLWSSLVDQRVTDGL